ncbi:MAG: hypothetical protein K2Y22_01125 [Candidatus Obscuribacterales bacterium]|nr:hypothetical protein [Candidatus Obscuribacterales bacterium]
MEKTLMKVLAIGFGLALILGSSAPVNADIDDDFGDDSPAPTTTQQSMTTGRRGESPVLQEADAMMAKQVREVASWMQNYCSSNVYFPNHGDEQTWVKAQLTELIPFNPYDPNSINQAESGVPIAAPLVGSGPGGEIFSYDEQTNEQIAQQDDRIHIQVEYGMTLEQAKEWQTNPPEEWQADAGTITILSTNQGINQNSPYDFFLVWGAGADGKPIRDPFTKRVVMVQGRWTQILGK